MDYQLNNANPGQTHRNNESCCYIEVFQLNDHPFITYNNLEYMSQFYTRTSEIFYIHVHVHTKFTKHISLK